MSKILTAEHVLLKLAEMCGNAASGRSVLALRDELLAHDAAFRTRLVEVEQALKKERQNRKNDERDIVSEARWQERQGEEYGSY